MKKLQMSETRTITFEQGCNTKQLCEIIDFIHEKTFATSNSRQ